jgi:hypothetical protein
VRVVKGAHVVGLGRVGDAGDTGLRGEVRLAQSAPLDEYLGCVE